MKKILFIYIYLLIKSTPQTFGKNKAHSFYLFMDDGPMAASFLSVLTRVGGWASGIFHEIKLVPYEAHINSQK